MMRVSVIMHDYRRPTAMMMRLAALAGISLLAVLLAPDIHRAMSAILQFLQDDWHLWRDGLA